MHPHVNRKMLSTTETALYLGLGKSTIDKFRLTAGGPVFRKFGNRVVYNIADLDTWADARKCTSTSEYLPDKRAA